MSRPQISRLVVWVLTCTWLCNTINGYTTTRSSADNVEGWEGPVAEIQHTLQTCMAKLDDLEDAMNDIGNGQHLVSVVGPPGPPGRDGRDGEDGFPGLSGPTGRDGRDGEDGEKGEDGRDGEDGEKGEDGRDGEDGEKGEDGRDGEDGEKGEDGRDGEDGNNGRDGRDGIAGPQGLPGDAGEPGAVGPKGDRGSTGPQAGGAAYTRWGRTTCGSDSTLIYVGFMGKTNYNSGGGGINYQCMVNDAEYNSAASSSDNYISGTEYKSYHFGIFENEAHEQNAPCAVCYANNRTTTLMMPGKRSCPTQWHKEYEGYLMSAHQGHAGPSTFECVDENPEHIRGEAGSNESGLLFFNRADCTKGIHCPEYDGNKAITCVVCTN